MDRFNLGKQCYDLKNDGFTNAQIVDKLDLSGDRRVRELVSYYTNISNAPPIYIINQSKRLDDSVPRAVAVEEIEETDLQQFIQFGENFSEEYMRVAVLNDIHFPDHEAYALEIVLKVLHDFRPHIIQDGSDVFDFSEFSRWPQTSFDAIHQAYEETMEPYKNWRGMLHQAVPNHRAFFMPGNHDIRYLNYVIEKFPQIYYKERTNFIQDIRRTGTWWFGEKRDIITVGQLAIVHGSVAGKNPAKALWDRIGFNYQITVAGHVHRRSMYEQTGYLEDSLTGIARFKTRVAATTGCLCKQRPSYNQSHIGQNWSHGFALATVDHKTGEVIGFDNIEIDPVEWRCVFGGKVYKS